MVICTQLYTFCTFFTAFHALMRHGSTSPAVGQTVKFGSETLDIGSGYNSGTSVYTAPMAGTWTFTWTLRVGYPWMETGDGFYTTRLVVNNSAKDALRTYFKDVATATAVVSLDAGDRVFIRVHRREGEVNIYSSYGGRGTFSGWMLN